ncbi:MAG TPA: di-heme enzyme [Polyangiaceae bacterium]|nr:di-heme enzyme [Polyangiaceae bacterium]
MPHRSCPTALVALLVATGACACNSDGSRLVVASDEATEPGALPSPARNQPSGQVLPRERAGAEPEGPSGSTDTPPERSPSGSEPTPERTAAQGDEFAWSLPPGFPPPLVPDDNPMSVAKVELGRHLFYDVRLSDNESMSCATCHRQELAFTDGRAVSVGSTGEAHTRGSMSLANVAYATTLTWGHPYLAPLERQAAVPMFGRAPTELGLTSEAALEERLRSIAAYEPLFLEAFPDDPAPIRVGNLIQALACFQRTLISGRSAYDRWVYDGDESALSESARRGFELFNSERLECFHCHLGFAMTDHISYRGQRNPGVLFHNTGLYNLDGSGAFPEPNTGVYDVTRDPADMGKFKAPTLRNIAVTAPYMHDGSIGTLSEVLDHYAAGGRTIDAGPYAGVGSESPLVSELVRGFTLSEQERADVIAFLASLTDPEFLENPQLSDPWTP